MTSSTPDLPLPRSRAALSAFLAAHGLRPRRRWGQNFMVDPNLVAFVVRAAGVGPGDRVLEIGTGTGLLTLALLEPGAEVTTVEADRRLFDAVAPRLEAGAGGRVRALCTDVLGGKHRLAPEVTGTIESWGAGAYKVVANLPYNVAVPVILNLLRAAARPARMVVTVQREVADRLLATPPGREFGRASVEAQLRAALSRVRDVPPEVFWPQPAVWSSIVSLTPFPDGMRPPPGDEQEFARFLGRVFRQRRKKLLAALEAPRPAAERRLAALGIDPRVRAESLPPAELVRVFRGLRGVVR